MESRLTPPLSAVCELIVDECFSAPLLVFVRHRRRARTRVGHPPHPRAERLRDYLGIGSYSPIVLFASSIVAEDTGALDVSSVHASKAAELDELKSMCTVPLPA